MLGSLKKFLAYFLAYKDQQDSCLDSPETSLKHWQVIREKPFLYRIYSQWYEEISAAIPRGDKPVLEIGSGGGFMREFVSGLLCTDIMPLAHNDMVLDACADFPFENESLRGIAMVNTFHHLPDAEKFLEQAQRCLVEGGVIVMLEPWVTGWSKLIYRNLHHEPFEPEARNWAFESSGPLSSANGALPWMVFERDRRLLQSKFPALKVERVEACMPFKYLLSGGVSMKALVPDFSFGFFSLTEKLMGPFMNHLGMFALLVVKKQSLKHLAETGLAKPAAAASASASVHLS